MRDYEAEKILGDDHQRRKTPYQRRRDHNIRSNERLYMSGYREQEDLRQFLMAARSFMESDVSKKFN